jgi:acyl dehydratase
MDFSIVKQPFGPFRYEYDWRRPSLYALSCGAGDTDLAYLLEPRPKVLPGFSDIVSYKPVRETALALKAEMLMCLHVAQKTTFHRALPAEGSLDTVCTIREIYDQGASALVVFEASTKDGEGPLFDTEWHVVYRAYGKFGGQKAPEPPQHTPPDRPPDARHEVKTSRTAALLHRLVSDDLNPIHADPQIARRMGFARPILHGVCTFGHAVRAATLHLGGDDPARVKTVEGRFVKPVLPDDTIITEVWRTSEREGLFVARTKEKNEVVIAAGRMVLKTE